MRALCLCGDGRHRGTLSGPFRVVGRVTPVALKVGCKGESITYRLDDPLILFRLHIAGLMVALAHMIGFEDMARVHMAPVHSVRVALTHMVVAGMVATVPVRR